MKLVLANLKGGTTKTTSSIYLACAFATDGDTVLIDSDPQGSAMLWAEAAETLPFITVSAPSPKVGQIAADLAQRYRHVIIDTPPGHPGITSGALGVADIAVLTMTPGSVDLPRFTATAELVEAAQGTNPSLSGHVLMTKIRRGTRSQRDVRAALAELDRLPVLDTESRCERQSPAMRVKFQTTLPNTSWCTMN